MDVSLSSLGAGSGVLLSQAANTSASNTAKK
jgi:hypothetical protein